MPKKSKKKEIVALTDITSPTGQTSIAKTVNLTDRPTIEHVKTIHVAKDVNGIAITDSNMLLFALGAGSNGGLGSMNLEDGELHISSQGNPYRQLSVSVNGDIMTSCKDKVTVYDQDLNKKDELSPGGNVWGMTHTKEGALVYGDPKARTVYLRGESGCVPIATKTKKNKLKSVWSVACGSDRVYITDRKKRQVVCHNFNGDFLWRTKVGERLRKYQTLLEDPAADYDGGLYVDDYNNVMVCDTVNDKLTVFSPRGDVLKHYSLECLSKPSYIAANKNYLVIITDVTMIDCGVQVYKFVD